MTQPLEPKQTLDLRTTKCPLNFVKTKLALEKLSVGEILEIWIAADSQSSINIPQSIQQEGHRIVKTEHMQVEVNDNQAGATCFQRLWICKNGSSKL